MRHHSIEAGRRLSRSLVLAVVLLLGAVVLQPGSASAADDGKAGKKAAKRLSSITLAGHGYGHGIGMSQHGAQGAGKQNKNYRQILGFYYPGTTFASFTGWVKVLITGDDDNNVIVRARSGLAVRDIGTKTTYPVPDNGATLWRFNSLNGKVQVAYYTDKWRAWRPTGQPTLAGVGEFRAPGAITLVLPSGQRAYRGFLRYDHKDTVNYLPIDHYLKGVVPAEMPASWIPSALRSQAIAARSYALHERQARLGKYWEICDTTQCQVYRGKSGENDRTNTMVDTTAGMYLAYGGKPAFTQFSSSSGGWTAKGSQPYLRAKADPWDDHPGNTVHDWRVTVPTAPLLKAYPRLHDVTGVQILARDGNGEWGGRVTRVRVWGTRDHVDVTGARMRTLLGLRSTWFRLA